MIAGPRRITVVLAVLAVAGCEAGSQDADATGGAEEAADPAAAVVPPDYEALSRPFDRGAPWGSLPGEREWGQVSGIGTSPEGDRIWIADRCGSNCLGTDRPAVFQLDLEGTVTASFGGSLFVRPHGLHVDPEGNVWVTDVRGPREEELRDLPEEAPKGHAVYKFSPRGELLLTLGRPGAPGAPPERLNEPNDVVTGPDGNIYVAEGHSSRGPHARISKFAPDGTFLMSWGQFGTRVGEFRTPHALAFDSRGRLFVADRGNSRIQVFDRMGRVLDEFRSFGRPNDVHIDDEDRLYVPDSESGDERNPEFRRGIYVGDARTGTVTGYVPPRPMEGRPQGTTGEGVTVDAAGNLYSAEVALRGLTRYRPRSR